MTKGHTKTAISLHHTLFQRAEAYATAHRLSRSELYARAVAEYLERREAEWLTAQMNTLYIEQDSALDEGVAELGFEALRRVESDAAR